ncbi:MAG: major outer membrane protein [Campylobacteraceae bacterium]
MKLVKLSLAAIVAAGAMTTFASATPLEEAIKGVDVSGFARYRFYHQSDAVYSDNSTQRNRFSGLLNIVSPITDNIKFGVSLSTDKNDYASNSASASGSIDVNKFWFQYANDALTVKAGKIEIPTPWTESGFGGTRGNGILALVTAVPDWTFAAAYYMQTNAMNSNTLSTYTGGGTWNVARGVAYDGIMGEEDLGAIAAIGKVGPVGLQLWAARMTNVFDYAIFGEASFAMEGFNVKGQANYLKLADETKGLGADDAGIFYGIQAGYKSDMFFVDLGYTKTDDDQPIYVLDGDNDGFIKFGKQLYYLTQNTPDQKVFFGKAGFSYDKFGFEAGYGHSKSGFVNDDKDEFYGQLAYKVAKNFGLQLYYSVLDSDDNSEDNNELRFQALYNF